MNALASIPALPVERTRRFRLCVPVLLVWVVLLPLTPLLSLALLIVCAVYGVNPFSVVAALFRVFAGFRGIHVEVQTREVSITIGLF
jgi:hypothetical protein